MTSSDAYEDEMGRFLRLSDEELSRLLAGEAGVRDEAFDEVASVLDEVRKTFVSAPDETTRTAHLAAISETSRLTADKGTPVARPGGEVHGPVASPVSGLPKWRSVMEKTIGFSVKAATAIVAASVSLMGLAYAGVDLPGQATERALEAVTGVELPNQGSVQGESVADDVRDVVESDLEGCERGQAIADAADANRHDETAPANDPCDQSEADGSRATGEENSAAGRANAAEKSGGASEAGAENAGTRDDEGRANGEQASSNGAENAGTHDDSGREKGSAAAEGGTSNNPTGTGP